MMRILGLVDLIIAVLLLAIAFNLEVSKTIVVVFALCLILKAIVFICDIASICDIIVGVLLLLSIFMVLPQLILFIAAGFIGIKGILSLFAGS